MTNQSEIAAVINSLPIAVQRKHAAAFREELTTRAGELDLIDNADATARDAVTLICHDIKSLGIDAGGFYGPYPSAERAEWRAIYRGAIHLLATEFQAEYSRLVAAWAAIG